MKRLTSLICVCVAVSSLGGCYNTYVVPSIEFRKLQSKEALSKDPRLQSKLKEEDGQKLLNRGPNDPVQVQTTANKRLAVTKRTRIFARSQGGRRYQVTPFNFSMYSSQLVASDRDYLKPLSSLSSFEVDLLSTGKTAGLIAAGVAVATGFIIGIVATSGEKKFQ